MKIWGCGSLVFSMGNDSLFCLRYVKGQDLACSSGPKVFITLQLIVCFLFGVLLPTYFKSDALISLSGDMS